MNALIDAALGHARPVLLVLALILVAGSVAYLGIPKEPDPDVAIPIVYVVVPHDGISPEDAERLLVRPMEKELRSIEGLKELSAVAQEGQASLTLEFEAGFDSDQALNDVREKVDVAKAELPDSSEEPTVHEVNVALFPVLVVSLYGDVSERARADRRSGGYNRQSAYSRNRMADCRESGRGGALRCRYHHRRQRRPIGDQRHQSWWLSSRRQ